MKNIINTILVLFYLVGANQTYGMEPENQPTSFIAFVGNHLILNDNKTIDSHNKKIAANLHKEKNEAQHCIVQNKATIISDLNALQNRIGKQQLSHIHNTLVERYESQRKIFENSQEDRFPIVFVEFPVGEPQSQKLSALIFDKKLILSSQSQPSALEKLQHCLYVPSNNGE